jgi:uncharacterized protein (DUF433 family)
MGDLVQLPPRGHYLAWEAGQLAGVSGNAIGQWARRGYIRASQSQDVPKVYSYQDVAEAMVVHQLLDSHVSYRRIRKTLEELRRDPDLGDWPLSQVNLVAAGSEGRPDVLVERNGSRYDLTGRPWHGMLDAGDLRKIATDLNRGGWAARLLPNLQHIEVDPDRLSGRPVIRGRRVSAQDVAETAEEQSGRETLEEGYGLRSEQIEDARTWWHEVQQLAA